MDELPLTDGPVIATGQDVRDALAQRFLDNASVGDDAANDDLVDQLAQWQRTRRAS